MSTNKTRALALSGCAWLAGSAAAQTRAVPSPESVFGKRPGDDFFLVDYDESRDYFRKLAQGSDRVRSERAKATLEAARL